MKRGIRKLLAVAALCLLIAVPVAATQQGSLLLSKVTEPVMLVPVADRQGVPTEDFSGMVEKLTQNDLTQDMAKKLYQHIRQEELSGVICPADGSKEAFFSSMEEGWYLVCSTAQPAEFVPFLICVPMMIGDKTVYHIQAEPKVQEPPEPSQPASPEAPKPNIPQTGAILWPQYLLLFLGAVSIGAGLIEVIRGREKDYE